MIVTWSLGDECENISTSRRQFPLSNYAATLSFSLFQFTALMMELLDIIFNAIMWPVKGL
jgi:hypothetical protein